MFQALTRRAAACALAVATYALVPAANAAYLEFGAHFMNITTTNVSGSTFGVNFTGSLELEGNANSLFLGALTNGTFVGNPNNYHFLELSGQIDFLNGNITGGFLEFSVTDSVVNGSVVNTFTANFLASLVSISHDQTQNQFQITGSLGNVVFTDNTFAGFDVSKFSNPEGYAGSFFGIAYNGQEVDNTTQVIGTAIIPGPAALALFGVAALCGRRRRR